MTTLPLPLSFIGLLPVLRRALEAVLLKLDKVTLSVRDLRLTQRAFPNETPGHVPIQIWPHTPRLYQCERRPVCRADAH